MITKTGPITAASFLSMFFLGISITVIGAAAKNIGLEPAQIGYLITAQNLGFMVSVAIVGALSDRYRKNILLFIGSVILSVSMLFFYRTDEFWLNFVLMALIGVGIGTYEGATDTMLLDIHDHHENLIINLNHFFVSAGSVAITGYLLYLQMGWRRATVQTGAIVAILAIVYAFIRIRKEHFAARTLRDSVRMLGKERILGTLFVSEVCALGLGIGSTGILTSFLMDYRNATQVTSKIGLMLFLSGLALGRIVSGMFGRRRGVVALVPVLFAVSIVLFSVLYFVPLGGIWLYVLISMAGLTIAPLLPMHISLAGLIFREFAGMAMGVVKVALPVGGIVIPFILSIIAKQLSFQASLALFPIIAAVGLVSYLVNIRSIHERFPG